MGKCNQCGGLCKEGFSVCWTCKNKSAPENKPEEVKAKKDEWRIGQIRGLCHTLTTQYLLNKWGANDSNFWMEYNDTFELFWGKMEKE